MSRRTVLGSALMAVLLTVTPFATAFGREAVVGDAPAAVAEPASADSCPSVSVIGTLSADDAGREFEIARQRLDDAGVALSASASVAQAEELTIGDNGAFALEIVDVDSRIAAYRYVDAAGAELRFRAVEVVPDMLGARRAVLTDTENVSVEPMGGRGCSRWNTTCLRRVFNSGCAHGGCAWFAWNLKLTAACLVLTCGVSVWNCCAQFSTPDPWDPDGIDDPVPAGAREWAA